MRPAFLERSKQNFFFMTFRAKLNEFCSKRLQWNLRVESAQKSLGQIYCYFLFHILVHNVRVLLKARS